MALMKLCRCGKKIDYNLKYCDKCIVEVEKERKQYHKQYDRLYRDRDSAAFYNSIEWQRVRQYILSKYRGLDLYAFFIDNEIVYADTVHHIIELKDNWNKRLDILSLFPLSLGNHTKIHKMYDKDKKKTQKLLFDLLKKWTELYG